MRSLLIAAIAALALGCNPQLSIPEGAQITCAAPADCSSGFFCDDVTMRCLPNKRRDEPVTVTPTLSPPAGQSAARKDDVVTVGGMGAANGRIVSATLLVASGQGDPVDVTSLVTLAPDGTLGGELPLAAFTGEVSVILEVVEQAHGNTSLPEKSQSAPLVVDNVAPTDVSASFPAAAAATPDTTLTIAAVGATEMHLEGDFVKPAGYTEWSPFQSSVAVRLTDGDGLKTVAVTVRDAAHNLSAPVVSTMVLLTQGVKSAPTLTSDDPSGKIGPKVAATVAGRISAGTTLDTAKLIAFNDAGGELACSVDVKPFVKVAADGALSGTITGASLCLTTARVALRVIARAGALSSTAAGSTSPAIPYDDAPPAGSAVHFAVPPAEPGFTNQASATLLLDASEKDGHPIEFAVSGDAVGSNSGTWLPFTGGLGSPMEVSVDLPATEGTYTLKVQFRDEIKNTGAEIPVTIVEDKAAPPPPVANLMRLEETNPSPSDPTKAADSFNVFALRSTSGAAANARHVRIYDDAALGAAHLLDTQLVDAGGTFTAPTLARNAARTLYVTALDAAGNESAATPISAPALSMTVSPRLAGNADVVTFTVTSPPGAATALLVDGAITNVTPTSAGFTYSRDSTSKPTEGRDLHIGRITAIDAYGNKATTACAFGFDLTAPVIDRAKIVVRQNDPGTPDTVEGLAGAVTDAVGGPITVTIGAPGTGLGWYAVTLDAFGGFAPLSMDRGVLSPVDVHATDSVGNKAVEYFDNDISPPSLVSPIATSPAYAGVGQTITIAFSTLDASALRALPSVTVNGRPATWISGTVSFPGTGIASPFVYQYVVGATESAGPVTVAVDVRDAFGNSASFSSGPGSSPAPTLVDLTPPSVALTVPVAGSWNGRPAVLGSASDGANGSGLQKVEVGLREVATGKYWDGSAFAATSPTFLAANGTTGFSFAAPLAALTAGSQYGVSARATDLTNNVRTSAEVVFTYTSAAPAAPTALAVTSPGEAKLALAWTQGGATAPASYRVYYGREGANDWFGTGATEGASPVTVPGTTTSGTLSELPRGRYSVYVVAVDASGNQSTPALGAGASRWWQWKTNPDVPQLHSALVLSSSSVMAVGANGALRRGVKGSTGDWTWADAALGTTHLVGLKRIGTRVVALSIDGKAFVSNDTGATFAPQVLPVRGPFYGLEATATDFFAYGAGVLYKSADGATWTSVPAVSGTQQLLSSAVSGAKLVFGGDGARLLVSTDGGTTFNWATTADATAKHPARFRAVAFSAGSSGNILALDDEAIACSTDGGATFSKFLQPSARMTDVVGAPGGFVIAGGNEVLLVDDACAAVTQRVFTQNRVTRAASSGPDVFVGGDGVYRVVLASSPFTLQAANVDPQLFVRTLVMGAGSIFAFGPGAAAVGRSTDFDPIFVTTANAGDRCTAVHAEASAPTGPANVLYACNDEVYESADSGETFTRRLGPPAPLVYSECREPRLACAGGNCVVGMCTTAWARSGAGAGFSTVASNLPTFKRITHVAAAGASARLVAGSNASGGWLLSSQSDPAKAYQTLSPLGATALPDGLGMDGQTWFVTTHGSTTSAAWEGNGTVGVASLGAYPFLGSYGFFDGIAGAGTTWWFGSASRYAASGPSGTFYRLYALTQGINADMIGVLSETQVRRLLAVASDGPRFVAGGEKDSTTGLVAISSTGPAPTGGPTLYDVGASVGQVAVSGQTVVAAGSGERFDYGLYLLSGTAFTTATHFVDASGARTAPPAIPFRQVKAAGEVVVAVGGGGAVLVFGPK